MSRYREPLLRAASDLQSRIYDIVGQKFLACHLQQGGPADQEYACRNTMFVFAEYLGWVEILRRGVQFLDLDAPPARFPAEQRSRLRASP